MSKSYVDLTETNFPQAVDTFDRATDITIDLLPLVQDYQRLYNSGKLNEASKILIDHPELQNCMINAKTINRCYDGIKALQRYYFSDIQKYIEQLITYRGEYSNKNRYEKYDVCLYNGSAYLCISDKHQVGISPTEQNYFVQVTLQGETGAPGLGLSFLGYWNNKTTYPKDAAVSFGTSLYASLIDNNQSKIPSSNSSYWSEIINFSDVTVFDNSAVGTTTETTMQGALEELYSITETNKTNIGTINSKLSGIESGAQKNTITGIKGSNEINYRTGNVSITPANLGITVVNNTADSTKSVKYAASAGSANSATTASTCTGNSATATSANYATSAGNSDTVDGFHFQLSTTDLTAGSSSLTTNTFYFVYE